MTAIALSAGYKQCRAVGCSHNAKANSNLSFFRFPKDERRCEVWLKNCGLATSNFTAENCYNNMRLCSDHFEDEMFASFHKNRLKKTAVPTLFTHDKPVEKVIFEEVPTPVRYKKRSFKRNSLKKLAASKKVIQKKSASTKNSNLMPCSPVEQVSLVVTPDVYSMTHNEDYDDEDDSDERMYNDNGACNYQNIYNNESDADADKYSVAIPKVEMNEPGYQNVYSNSIVESFLQRIPKVDVNVSTFKGLYDNNQENGFRRIPITDLEMPNYQNIHGIDSQENRTPEMDVELPSYQSNHENGTQKRGSRRASKTSIDMASYQNAYVSNGHENSYLRIPKQEVEIFNYQGDCSDIASERIPKMEVNTSQFRNMYGDAEANQHRSMLSGLSANEDHSHNGLRTRVNDEQMSNSELRPKVTVDDFMDFCDSYFNKNLASFIKSQIQLQELQGNVPKGIRYDETFKELALSIYTLDPKVYKFLSKTFHLPSKSTLMRSRNF